MYKSETLEIKLEPISILGLGSKLDCVEMGNLSSEENLCTKSKKSSCNPLYFLVGITVDNETSLLYFSFKYFNITFLYTLGNRNTKTVI